MIVSQSARIWTLARYVGRRLAVLFAFDVAVVAAYVFCGWTWLALPHVPLSTIGGVIGVLAGFRNASAYARWWEARTIWGGIVKHSRSFARQVLTMILPLEVTEATQSETCEVKRKLVLLQIAYVHALRHHLRGAPPWPDLTDLIPANEIDRLRSHSNVPLAIQQNIASLVAQCRQAGWIEEMRWASLDRTLGALMDCQGASERIKNTPMPRQYDTFIRFFISVYCLLLPFAMVPNLGLLTPIGSTLAGFVFLALDQIGRDLETPFDNLPHDISLTAISRTIEINLKQMIGQEDTPQPLAPVDGVLW
jgi:putative membrane protein